MTTHITVRLATKAAALAAIVAVAATPVMAKTRHVNADRSHIARIAPPTPGPTNTYGAGLGGFGTGPDWGWSGVGSYEDAARMDRQMNRGF